MKEFCQRFPLMAQKILNHVDNETLINFKTAGRNNDNFLRKERFYWMKIIQMYNFLIGDLHEVWKKVVRKTPVEIIKELVVAVHQFTQKCSERLMKDSLVNSMSYSSIEAFVQQQTEKDYLHPLFIGAACGSVNLCNHIIQKSGVTDPKITNDSTTPLVFAAKLNGDLNVFRFLLEKAVDKNPILRKYDNWTLFHDLAEEGRLEMCRLMVAKVEDKSPRNIDGQTPYHIAASAGHVELCQIMMKDLMDKNPQDYNGSTPYHMAALFGHVELCRIMTEKLINKNPMDHDGQTPFCLAASYGHLEVCRIFMETFVDEDQVENCVRIPLHIAARKGHVEVVRLFMAIFRDKNLNINERQMTPLISAIHGGHLNVCKLLIEEFKVDVNLSDEYGNTPLHLASKSSKPDIFKFLCKNTFSNYAKTPFDPAILEHKREIDAFLEDRQEVDGLSIVDKNVLDNEKQNIPQREEYEEI